MKIQIANYRLHIKVDSNHFKTAQVKNHIQRANRRIEVVKKFQIYESQLLRTDLNQECTRKYINVIK